MARLIPLPTRWAYMIRTRFSLLGAVGTRVWKWMGALTRQGCGRRCCRRRRRPICTMGAAGTPLCARLLRPRVPAAPHHRAVPAAPLRRVAVRRQGRRRARAVVRRRIRPAPVPRRVAVPAVVAVRLARRRAVRVPVVRVAAVLVPFFGAIGWTQLMRVCVTKEGLWPS
jgi:hypothetical protein